MRRSNETAQSGSREFVGNELSTLATVAPIAVTAMQLPDVLVWLAR